MSKTPDNAFDLGSQMPGTSTPVTFDKAGIVAVICAIHPRMRLTIKVTD
jgi:plastocyanin